MDPIVRLVVVTVLSYLVGSIPTALIVSKNVFGYDIREKGSGNVGSTNAYRLMGVKWGLFVQLADVLKGVLAVTVVAYLFNGEVIPFPNKTPFEDMTLIRIICGIMAVIGHIWSAFAQFRGGKGINTAAGMLLGIAPVEFAVIFALFVITVGFSGYISLGSIVAALALPTTMIARYNVFNVSIEGYHTVVWFLVALSLLVLYTHRTNIERLLAGEENKFPKLQIFKPKNPSNPQ
jgi:acyl phosphate:glycerol-3-phosphate acyltransferase